MPDPVTPKLGAESFSCPHCGALAHQSWFRLFLDSLDPKQHRPSVVLREDVLSLDTTRLEEENQKAWEELKQRFQKNEITYDRHGWSRGHTLYLEMWNAWVSKCYACDGFTFWIKDKIAYPITNSEIKPHEDLPASLRDDFEEAVSVLELSPRSSAALLRLCIQKLMMELKQKGRDLNEDIGALVSQGLDARVQKALDVLRVIGNNAVHPGQIDLKDDKETAISLFQLLNAIVERCITVNKKIDDLYAGLPPTALSAIKSATKCESHFLGVAAATPPRANSFCSP
jgi:hypothetical protein